jgi:hypothetical protein
MSDIWRTHSDSGLIKKSDKKNKKLMTIYNGKKIHFGDVNYQHYFDKTGIHKEKNHMDSVRRTKYRRRHEGVTNNDGDLVYKNPNSSSYWSYNILW